MDAVNRKIGASVILLGAALLCGCAALTEEMKASPPNPSDNTAVRLPYGTAPLTIEQASTPPLGAEQAITPSEVQEGLAHSLRLFQIDFGHAKKSPASFVETPGPSEAEPVP